MNKKSKNFLTLIVDDEPDIRELLEITLARMDIDTISAENITQAHQLLAANDFDLCLTDMRLPDGDGIDFVRHIQQSKSFIPVAVITAHGNMELAIEALKAGAFDFVSKPVDLNILRNLVSTALKVGRKDDAAPIDNTASLLGKSAAIQKTRQTILKLARSQAPVYISGESGSGKELAARLIHENSPRAEGPFIPVNCGAIPSELVESEFFGHKKGSFTGAVSDKRGLFQAAEGGTLFLDEVADLPLDMQVKLLRAIQEKAIRPVGTQTEISVNIRILSATHKNLLKLTGLGKFRQDLYFRINVIELAMPSLRQRAEDIPLLVAHFLRQIAQEWQTHIPKMDTDSLRTLQQYAFPGNVRELENILERAMTLCENNIIQADDLRLPAPGETISGEFTQPAPLAPEQKRDGLSNISNQALEAKVDQTERDAINQALQQTRYNRTAAAKLLGLTLRQLRYRIQKLGID
jgi:two-component system response regulator PilR (NtrC family)